PAYPAGASAAGDRVSVATGSGDAGVGESDRVCGSRVGCRAGTGPALQEDPGRALAHLLRISILGWGRGCPACGIRCRAIRLLWSYTEWSAAAARPLEARRRGRQRRTWRGDRSAVCAAVLSSLCQTEDARPGREPSSCVRGTHSTASLDVCRDKEGS